MLCPAQSREELRLKECFPVVLSLVLCERREVIEWLESNQVEEGVEQFADENQITPLLEFVEPDESRK